MRMFPRLLGSPAVSVGSNSSDEPSGAEASPPPTAPPPTASTHASNRIVVARGRRVPPVPEEEFVSILLEELANGTTRKLFDMRGCQAMKRVRIVMDTHGSQSQEAYQALDTEAGLARQQGISIFSKRMHHNLIVDETVPGSNLKVSTKKKGSNGGTVVQNIIPLEYYYPMAMEYISRMTTKVLSIQGLKDAFAADQSYMNFQLLDHLIPTVQQDVGNNNIRVDNTVNMGVDDTDDGTWNAPTWNAPPRSALKDPNPNYTQGDKGNRSGNIGVNVTTNNIGVEVDVTTNNIGVDDTTWNAPPWNAPPRSALKDSPNPNYTQGNRSGDGDYKQVGFANVPPNTNSYITPGGGQSTISSPSPEEIAEWSQEEQERYFKGKDAQIEANEQEVQVAKRHEEERKRDEEERIRQQKVHEEERKHQQKVHERKTELVTKKNSVL